MATPLRRALALAAILAVALVLAFESLPHRHPWGADDSRCPACQAARQHVGSAPAAAGVLLRPPEPNRPEAAGPAIVRAIGVRPAPCASPRSPPLLPA